jgi:hypothetical protein
LNLEEETVPVKAVIFTAEDAEVRGGNRKMGGSAVSVKAALLPRRHGGKGGKRIFFVIPDPAWP